MSWYGYSRYRRRRRSKTTTPRLVATVYHSLKVPSSVYERLKRRFTELSEAEDRIFLCEYRKRYGESAYRYLLNTYRRTNIDGRFLLNANPSGQTLERILQLVPKVLTTDERFSLFEEILNYNEPERDQATSYYSYGSGSDEKFSFSYNEWLSFGENKVVSAIRKLGDDLASSIDYQKKYDFTDISWLLDNDIAAFCHLIEQTRKVKIKTKIEAAVSDLSLLRNKWVNLENGTVSSSRHKELQYSFVLDTGRISLTIYDAKERAKEKRREKLNDALGMVGCLGIIVIFILFAMISKK